MTWRDILNRFMCDLLDTWDLRYLGKLPGSDGVRLFDVAPHDVADFLGGNHDNHKRYADPEIGNVVESYDGVTRWCYSYDKNGRIDLVRIGPHGPDGRRAMLWWRPERGWFVEEAR